MNEQHNARLPLPWKRARGATGQKSQKSAPRRILAMLMAPPAALTSFLNVQWVQTNQRDLRANTSQQQHHQQQYPHAWTAKTPTPKGSARTHTRTTGHEHPHGSHLPVVEQQEDGLQDLIGAGQRGEGLETARRGPGKRHTCEDEDNAKARGSGKKRVL